MIFWLVLSTHLKNISQVGNLPQVVVNIKNIWNHHLAFVLEKEEKVQNNISSKWFLFNPVCHSRSQGFRTTLCGRNSDCKVEQLQHIPEKKHCKNIWPNIFAGLFKISSPTFCGALWRLPCFAPVKRPSVTTIGQAYHWPWALWETSWLKMQESQPCLDVSYFFPSPSASKKFNLALWTGNRQIPSFFQVASLKLTVSTHLKIGCNPKGNEKVFQPSIFRRVYC